MVAANYTFASSVCFDDSAVAMRRCKAF
jgi:hypothetical protein